MTKLQLISAVAALLVSAPAFAQFSNATSSSSRSASRAFDPSEICKDYNRISLSYTNTSLTGKNYTFDSYGEEKKMSLNGVALDYIHGFSVSHTVPVFIETGLKLNLGFATVEPKAKNDDDAKGYPDMKYQQMYLAVPINFAYKIRVSDAFSITPYLGLNIKLNVMGRNKMEAEDENGSGGYYPDYGDDDNDWYSYNNYDYSYGDNYGNEDDWRSLYSDDEKDGQGKNYAWNRFQLGWHVGLGLQIKSLYLGVNYGTDFMKAFKYKKETISTGNLAVSVGYCF